MTSNSPLHAVEDIAIFNRLAADASRTLKSEIGLVSIVCDECQLFLGASGLSGPLVQAGGTPISHSICAHVRAMERPLVIENGHVHPLVMHNKAVTELGIISYLGHPIYNAAQRCIGAVCVANTRMRRWQNTDVVQLSRIARMVDREMARLYEPA